jgi:hypothetical protein
MRHLSSIASLPGSSSERQGTGSRCTLGHSNRAAAREASEGDLIDFLPRKTSIEARRLAQEYDVFVRDWGFAIQFVLCHDR